MRPLALGFLALTLGGAGAAGSPVTGDIYVVSSSGGPRQALTSTPEVELQPAVSPDGRLIAYLSDQIRLMNADGSEQRPLDSAWGERPRWSPDGRSLVYTAQNDSHCYPPPAQRCVVTDIWTVGADGAGAKKILDGALHPVWSRSGRALLFREFPLGEPGEVRSLKIASSDGTDVRTLFSRENERTYLEGSAASWSPNGKWIAFTFATIHAGGLYLVRANGSHLHRLTVGADPAWSPNGKLIAFQRGHGVWVISPTGKRARRVTADGRCPTWSPRGRWIAFLTNATRPESGRLGIVRPNGRGRRMLSEAADCYAYGWAEPSPPVWSPDGRRIYFVG